jgi:hypothetical protein
VTDAQVVALGAKRIILFAVANVTDVAAALIVELVL